MMEEKDPIENRFKSAFSGYKQEPPDGVWENLHAELHPLTGLSGFLARFTGFSLLAQRSFVFYLGLAGISIGIFIAVIYFSTVNHQTVRGHAYAGKVRLDGGNAALFAVDDKMIPWDSVTHYRSAIVDHYGHFRFSGVRSGRYLLRVAPAVNSEAAELYMPSWFDMHETTDSGRVIEITKRDVSVEVRLVKRNQIKRR